jgi:hypothetical protein
MLDELYQLCHLNNKYRYNYYVSGHYPSSCLYLKHRPLYFSKYVSETGFFLRLQVKPTQLVLETVRNISFLSTVLELYSERTVSRKTFGIVYILQRVQSTETPFGFLIGFIDHLQVVTAINYSTVTHLHNLHLLHANISILSAVFSSSSLLPHVGACSRFWSIGLSFLSFLIRDSR